MTAVTLSWLAVLILVILSLSNLAEAKSKQRDNDDEDWGDGGFLKNQKPYTVEIEDLTLDGGSSPVIGDDVPDDQMVDSHMSNLYSEMMSTGSFFFFYHMTKNGVYVLRFWIRV